MKSKLVVLTLLFASSLSCMSQTEVKDHSGSRPYFGVRIAGELTCPADINIQLNGEKVGIEYSKLNGGVEIGGIYNIPMAKHIYIEPGINLFYNRFSINNKLIDGGSVNMSVQGASIRKYGLRIPVNAGFRFIAKDNLDVEMFTGPELEIGIIGKYHLTDRMHKVTQGIYGSDGDYNRIDLNWTFGVGLNINNKYIALSGDVGLLNMLKNTDGLATLHENRIALTLGHNF